MEDDDSDTSMTIDESMPTEKTPRSPSVLAAACSEVVSGHVSSPKVEETHNDVTKSESEDIRKSLSSHGNGLPPTSKTGEKNVDVVVSDSDVPKSPKKVNGEVQSLECELEQQSNVDVSVNSGAAERVRLSDEDDDKDTNFEQEKSRGSSNQTSVLSSEIKEVKEDGQNTEINAEYKGFKKKIIAQTSIASNNVSDHVPITEGAAVGASKSVKSKRQSPKNTVSTESQHVLVSHQPLPDGTQSSAQLTEYAQYLGLQPTVKFKCYKCGESGFPSMLRLQEHQNICLKNVSKLQTLLKPTPPPAPSEPSPSMNFRITRKVYLCSACGTYYENWNLFLHMREVHKRHICLFCLGMFSQADKLAAHLAAKHSVVEASYTSIDHFIGENKGSFFLMCCTCERIFTERENYYEHSCSEGLIINAEKACSLCGLRGAHFPTCRRAFTDNSNSPPSSSTIPAPLENPAEPTQSSQHGIQERNALVTKYLIPVTKPPGKKPNKGNTMQENLGDGQEKSRDLSDIDDDYDISNAASFCHVNIHEPQEKQKAVSATKLKTYKGKSQDGIGKKTVTDTKSRESSPTSIKENENTEKCIETTEQIQDEAEKDTTETEEVVAEKVTQESEKVMEEETKETVVETENKESACDVEPEPEKMDVDEDLNNKTETEKCSSHEVLAKEETEVPPVSDANTEPEEETTPELLPPIETSEKLSPKPETSPKLSPPQTETKLTPKTQSATEAESESESSDSGDESDSSSSSDASSEESDHHEEAKTEEKMEESDVDNADSDKMSLVVDENRSEEETDLRTEQPNQEADYEDEDKDEAELKISEEETVKQDEPKSDAEIVDNAGEDNEENKSVDEEKVEEPGESIQLAGDDVPLLELTLEENLDTMHIQLLLKESVKVSCLNCVYCNHAKKIAVNGKQLALHLLAEHRFAPVVCSDSGELTEADGFVDKLKSSLSELQHMFFNTDSYDSMDHNCMRPYDRTYECFHCHFLTTLHKELYVHNRKMHQKTILLCIMCKSNFYSYSELLCHLCPGIYVPESNIKFRCCLCTVDGLPSAFRLMVHLRKRHHACDVCLETTGDQQKLSNHVWKHKLHHLCYRCGIAYRNKPDITKHLFWKHGTESVLCKKCLQKKWPHVYHFCIPPNAFVCEECNSSFSRAVALKVHKRLHVGDLPYSCDECEERFISRKLLTKHQEKHREPTLDVVTEINMQENGPTREAESHEDEEDKVKPKPEIESHKEMDEVVPEIAADNSSVGKAEEEHVKDSAPTPPMPETKEETPMDTSLAESSGEGSKLEEKDTGEKKSKVLDVYDLPPLNLSSDSDDSDDDDDDDVKVDVKSEKCTVEKETVCSVESVKEASEEKTIDSAPSQEEPDESQQPIQVVDGIWENFKTYKANLEKRESKQMEAEEMLNKKMETEEQIVSRQSEEVISIINMEHDYCGPPAGTSVAMEEIPESVGQLEETPTHVTLLPVSDGEKPEETKEKTDDELKACDADHNYCFTNPSGPVNEEKEKEQTSEQITTTASPSKKKQKSPKKKQKRSASSSSSDSSSNSDSSTCSCGTNCSCSSSSSSSSGSSSSQSSDSDSSSSEGRRRQAARRERRRERARKRKAEETEEAVQLAPPPQSPKVEPIETAANGPPGQEEAAPAVPSLVEPEDMELPIRESDLDTDETETDEDFYDKYPQKLANKILAEKRNQLLLLAAVAPVNNGTMSQSCQSPPPSSVEEPVPKKKLKTKKHKKSQHQQHATAENKVENKIKLNIPTDYYSSQTPVYSKATVPSSSTSNSVSTTSLPTSARTTQSPFLVSHPEPSTPTASYQSTGSGSETESKRLSKRKRVPKKFYGDSSDEEHEQQQPPLKWRKVSTASSNSPVPTPPSIPTFTYKSTPVTPLESFHNTATPVPANEEKSEEEVVEDSDSDHEDAKKSSSESSNSESEGDKDDVDDDLSDPDSDNEDVPSPVVEQGPIAPTTQGENVVQQKNENLYCYCQCPYDEVSEMIACDGKDCTIEWFHFECVGIMVPPKGKWFCPDCRKRAAARSEYLLHV